MGHNNKLLFLSMLYPADIEDSIRNNAKDGMYESGIELQKKIIKGLETNLNQDIVLCNVVPIGSYPKHYKKAMIKSTSFNHNGNEGHVDYNVGFFNVMWVKHILLDMSVKFTLDKIFNENQDISRIVIYSASIFFAKTIKLIRRKNKDAHITVIIPDMPEFNNMSDNLPPHIKLYQKYSAKKFRKLIREVNSLIYMTEQTNDYIRWNKSYAVIEGIADDKYSAIEDDDNHGIKTVVYTGTTHRCYGIMNLIEAFHMIEDDNCKLVICGTGDSDEEIIRYSEIDSRIEFKGVVSHQEALSVQKQASVLVNPRQNIGEYTRYSFPSKTMEYLTAGVPVVAYKLDGIPDEYDDYITYASNNTVQALYEAIVNVLNKARSDRIAIGIRARRFVLKEKNPVAQTKKIIELMNKN